MKTKKTAIFLITIILSVLLAGCGCSHEWQPSTCLAPRTCTLCGETQGKVRAHNFGSTACSDPQPCTVCGTFEGMELTHEWQKDAKICIHCGLDERPADIRFMEKLAEGINERWSLFYYEGENLTQEDWKRCFQAEYDKIIPFWDETFRNKKLGEAARRYIACVAASMEAVETFDPETWNDVYQSDIFQEQTVALYLIHTEEPVPVAEEHQERLIFTVEHGEIINMIYPFFDEILFLFVDESGGMKKYETTLKNTTKLNFKEFTFEINLYDAEGNIIDTVESTVNRWKSGQKIRFNFKTDLEFKGLKVQFAQWDF